MPVVVVVVVQASQEKKKCYRLVAVTEANEVGRNVVQSCKGCRNWEECVLLLTRKWLMRQRKSPGHVSLWMMSAIKRRNRNTIWQQIGFLSCWSSLPRNRKNNCLTFTVQFCNQFLKFKQTNTVGYKHESFAQLFPSQSFFRSSLSHMNNNNS